MSDRSGTARDPGPSGPTPVRVGVLGGSGYTGQEVLTLLARHPLVQVAFATSRGDAGRPTPIPGLGLTPPDETQALDADVLFLCLPHGESAAWVDRLRTLGASTGRAIPRIIDLTADHRPGSGRSDGAVFGLAEWNRAQVTDAPLVANPGCYPTGVLLSLLPLRERGLIDETRLTMVQAASGVTGAGRTPKTELLFSEVFGDFRAYGGGNQHRHLLEMRALLPGFDLLFQPHLLPVARGILETILVPVVPGVDPDQVRAVWRDRYAGEGAIRVLERGTPALRDVVGTDRLHLGVEALSDLKSPAVLVVAAFDNLGKGAAGQAVQNLNAMMGWPNETGIRC
jgi:N-acetyl-gamma-glutamyl-phosphate reductase